MQDDGAGHARSFACRTKSHHDVIAFVVVGKRALAHRADESLVCGTSALQAFTLLKKVGPLFAPPADDTSSHGRCFLML